MRLLTEMEVVAELASACERAGSANALAKAHGLTAAYVSDVLAGRRRPGPKILHILGLTKKSLYEHGK